jgi:hypothetical protein
MPTFGRCLKERFGNANSEELDLHQSLLCAYTAFAGTKILADDPRLPTIPHHARLSAQDNVRLRPALYRSKPYRLGYSGRNNMPER